MIRRSPAGQEGQALVLVLALMVLSIPMITGALGLASTLLLDAQSKMRILRSQYAGFGAEQAALFNLLATPGSSTTTQEINGVIVTTTVVKLTSPPRELPTYALEGRLSVSKTSNPTSTAANATTTYTVVVRNPKAESVTVEKIIDILPTEFSYVAGTAVIKDSDGIVISTSTPQRQIYEYVWTVPANTVLDSGESMTLSFQAQASSTLGIFCNEAYVYPGGIDTSSGKGADVQIGVGAGSGCRGGVISVTKTVSPRLVYSGVTTTYAFAIQIENKGATVVNIKEIKDIPSPGFTYVPLSATSSEFVPPEPPVTSVNNNNIVWKFDGLGLELPTSTTFELRFQTIANLSRGIYPNKVDMVFAGVQQPSPSLSGFCQFGDTSLTISQGSNFDCPVGSNGDVTIEQGSIITGGITSLGGDILLQQQTVVGSTVVDGDIMALGGDVTINQQCIITGDMIVAGSLNIGQQVTIQGNVIVGGDFVLSQQVTITGYLWVGGNLTIKQQVSFSGDIVVGGNLTIEQQVDVGGDIFAGGSVTADQQVDVVGSIQSGGNVIFGQQGDIDGAISAAGTVTTNDSTVDGEITEGAAPPDIPDAPLIDLESTGTTASVTAIDIYRITTDDGTTTRTCDVIVTEDIDTGTYGTVENCSTTASN